MKKTPIKKTVGYKTDIYEKINYLIKNKLDFKLILSNYTTEIVCPSIPFFNIKFMQNNQPPISFIAYQKIKKDLMTWTANEMPNINKNECTYFAYNKKIKPRTGSEATNLDLSSAYATILFNDFFISEETYKFISRLDKKQRLVCVGMLASHKDIYTYQQGRPILQEEIINPLENYFYYCVDRTAEIMNELIKMLENDFIFTWVDSVYYDKSIGNDYLLSSYLDSINIKYKIQDLMYLNIEKKPALIKLDFFDAKNKKKAFNIPTEQTYLKTEILRYYNLI